MSGAIPLLPSLHGLDSESFYSISELLFCILNMCILRFKSLSRVQDTRKERFNYWYQTKRKYKLCGVVSWFTDILQMNCLIKSCIFLALLIYNILIPCISMLFISWKMAVKFLPLCSGEFCCPLRGTEALPLWVMCSEYELTTHILVPRLRTWKSTFTPPYILNIWHLIQHRGTFGFYHGENFTLKQAMKAQRRLEV